MAMIYAQVSLVYPKNSFLYAIIIIFWNCNNFITADKNSTRVNNDKQPDSNYRARFQHNTHYKEQPSNPNKTQGNINNNHIRLHHFKSKLL